MNFMRSQALLAAALLAAACSSNSTGSSDGGPHDAGSDDAGTHDAGVTNPDGGQVLHGDGGSAPGAPQLSFTTSQTGVQLSWTLPGATGGELFTLTRADDGAPFATVAGASEVTATSYTDDLAHAQPGAIHQYQVVAIDGNGATPSNVVEVLQAPGDVAAGGSDTKVIVLWGNIANAASYNVYRVPAADAGGSPALLGNVLNGEFVDDGSMQPISAGGSYSYQIVALNQDGGQPSTGSNIAATTALGLDVTDQVTHLSDLDGGVTVPGNANLGNEFGAYAAVADGGTFTGYEVFSSSAATVVPGVPAGATWYFTTDSTFYFQSNARSIDLSNTVTGRVDAAAADNLPSETAIAYALTGLSPWVAPTSPDAGNGDMLISVSAGAGNEVTGVDRQVDGGIAGGGTSFTGVESIDGNVGDWHLVDSTQGDILYLLQLHQETSGGGKSYQTVSNAVAKLGVTMPDGVETQVAAPLALLAPTAIPDLKVKTSAYVAQASAIGTGAASSGQTVTVEAQRGFDTYGNYGFPVPLMIANVPGSATADTDFGLAGYGDPFPSSWGAFVDVKYGFNVKFDLTGDNGPATFNAVSESYAPAAGFDFAAGITPGLQPVTNLQINGKSAFSDQVSVTTSPTLSWTAPTASASPIVYFVSLYELSLDSGGDTTIGNPQFPPPYYTLQDVSLYTTETSLTLPAAFLTADDTHSHWYFVTVDAQITELGGAAIDQTKTPYKSGTSYLDVEVVSNKFTPGAGTKPPSTFNRAPPHHAKSPAKR